MFAPYNITGKLFALLLVLRNIPSWEENTRNKRGGH